MVMEEEATRTLSVNAAGERDKERRREERGSRRDLAAVAVDGRCWAD